MASMLGAIAGPAMNFLGGQSLGSSSSASSNTSNQAFPELDKAYGSQLGVAPDAASQLQQLLSGNSTGFDAYKNATGFNFAQDQGEQGIMQQMRSMGLGTSGAAMKGLDTFNTGLQNQYASNYTSGLNSLGGLGNQMAQILASAGNKTTSGSSSGSGLMGLFG